MTRTAAPQDGHRATRSITWLEGLAFDLRLAVRGLMRDRGFALTAIVTLAIALALNVTVYTIREAMVVRGLPLARDNDRVGYVLQSQLVGVSPYDPLTLALGPLLLLIVALAGCRLPAWRAVRVDPVVALRQE